MRLPLLLAGLALAGSVLTGCGGGDDADSGTNDTETYCAKLKDDKAAFTAFSGSGGDVDPGQIGDAIDRFHELADAAPKEVQQDWDLLDGALSEIERGLAEAGISDKDLAGLQNGDIPKGVDVGKLTKLLPKVQALQGKEIQDAVKSIRTHAKDACGVTVDAPAAGS